MTKKKISHTKKIEDAIADFKEAAKESFERWPKPENEIDLLKEMRGNAKTLYLDLDDML